MVEQINIKPDVVLDLGNKGCGELAISLMIKMKAVAGGQVLEVHALDIGAQNDIPAWCRLTKNELIAGPCGESNAFYYIKKKIQ